MAQLNDGAAVTIQEEISQIKKKLQVKQPGGSQEEGLPKFKKRRGFMEMSGVKFNGHDSTYTHSWTSCVNKITHIIETHMYTHYTQSPLSYIHTNTHAFEYILMCLLKTQQQNPIPRRCLKILNFVLKLMFTHYQPVHFHKHVSMATYNNDGSLAS